jgi:hypothetical protein
VHEGCLRSDNKSCKGSNAWDWLWVASAGNANKPKDNRCKIEASSKPVTAFFSEKTGRWLLTDINHKRTHPSATIARKTMQDLHTLLLILILTLVPAQGLRRTSSGEQLTLYNLDQTSPVSGAWRGHV